MAANRTVIVGGAVIVTVGYANAIVTKGNPTRVIIGGIGVVLIASLMEMAGPNMSKLATAVVGLAIMTVILVEAPGIAKAVQNAQANAGKSAQTNPTVQTGGSAASRPGVGQPGHSGLSPG